MPEPRAREARVWAFWRFFGARPLCKYGPMAYLRARIELLLFIASAVLLLGGGAAWLLGRQPAAGMFWAVGTVLGLVFAIAWTAGAFRRRQARVDVIAVRGLLFPPPPSP